MLAIETQNCTLLAARYKTHGHWSINQLPVRTSRWQSHRHQSTSEGRPLTPMHGDGTVCPPETDMRRAGRRPDGRPVNLHSKLPPRQASGCYLQASCYLPAEDL